MARLFSARNIVSARVTHFRLVGGAGPCRRGGRAAGAGGDGVGRGRRDRVRGGADPDDDALDAEAIRVGVGVVAGGGAVRGRVAGGGGPPRGRLPRRHDDGHALSLVRIRVILM